LTVSRVRGKQPRSRRRHGDTLGPTALSRASNVVVPGGTCRTRVRGSIARWAWDW